MRTWVSLVLTGETVGFVVPGLAWFAAWKAGLPPLAAAAIVVPAGACEGAILGFSQWLALRNQSRALPVRWIPATAAGAGIAWACGMTPNTVYDLGAPAWLAVAVGGLLAPVLLLSLPVTQWFVLRRSLERAWRWVPWSVAAWALALPVTFVAPALLPSNAPDSQVAAAWAVSGLVMATVLALVSGLALRRLLADYR